MKIERGNYRVMVACCSSGNCAGCLGRWVKTRRHWKLIADKVSKKTATQIAQNWAAYDPRIEPAEQNAAIK